MNAFITGDLPSCERWLFIPQGANNFKKENRFPGANAHYLLAVDKTGKRLKGRDRGQISPVSIISALKRRRGIPTNPLIMGGIFDQIKATKRQNL